MLIGGGQKEGAVIVMRVGRETSARERHKSTGCSPLSSRVDLSGISRVKSAKLFRVVSLLGCSLLSTCSLNASSYPPDPVDVHTPHLSDSEALKTTPIRKSPSFLHSYCLLFHN